MYFLDLEMPCRKGFVNEHAIIQIGMVSSGNTLKYISNVNPGKKHMKISAYCTELTGIQKADLEVSPDFPTIFLELKRYFNNKQQEIYVWGDADSRVLENVCNRYGLPLIKVVNYQQVLMNKFKLKFNPSLSNVCKILNIKTELEHHNALTDAKLLRAVYKKIGKNPEEAKYLFRAAEYQKRIQEINKMYRDIVTLEGEYKKELPKVQEVVVN
ncbi:exonuclease domain-containing protein [Fredinandcohnia sp. 179-A 10B2 NHS]|uniref:exonuclease domain-containing protein n=1 Tax=Fredinandcohnia sp. 179-A 10B2 NHS TaxID=3235176 RepID=UPI00399F40FC